MELKKENLLWDATTICQTTIWDLAKESALGYYWKFARVFYYNYEGRVKYRYFKSESWDELNKKVFKFLSSKGEDCDSYSVDKLYEVYAPRMFEIW